MTSVETTSKTVDGSSTGDRAELAAQRILTDQLPIPVRQRWQPLRIGLMNLFLFEDERFPFADGRLLLRGSNGTGKSRVLAMTLPLLLDGSFKATRVEPDRDPNRQVAWNLLMDDQQSATGYSWLEFGRIDEDGVDRFVTIGCGMRAIRGQRIKPWFFISELRVDEPLAFKSIDGVPLTSRRLAETLADSGQVYETASEYRRAVDERLFRLGERYDPLIDLLLQLRQPKLAEKLDIVQLETVLREALPPLPESLLDDAAEAFRDLDQYRNLLQSDRQTLDDIRRFMKPYRDHVGRGVKRALKSLTTANSKFESAQRDLRNFVQQKGDDEQSLREGQAQQQTLKIRIESGQAAINELMQSPEMQDAKRLDEQKTAAQTLAERLESYNVDFRNAEVELTEAGTRLDSIANEVRTKRKTAADESEKCRNTAAPESLQNKHREELKSFLEKETFNGFSEIKKSLGKGAKRFLKSAEHLIGLNAELEHQLQTLKSTRETVQRFEQQRQENLDQLESAKQQKESARTDLWEAILDWYQNSTWLKSSLPPIESWADQWNDWSAETYLSDPSISIVESARSSAIAELIATQERLRHQHHQLDSEKAVVEDELQRLESGEALTPPPRSHRKPASNKSVQGKAKSGLPFWKLVDFQPDVPARERGNWESALHDAGLLDAVLLPDGRLINTEQTVDGSTEIQLASNGLPDLEESRQLSRVLCPSDDFGGEGAAATMKDSLLEILSVVGVGHDAGLTWVAHDGSWQNGPLHGKLTKTHPQYIGHQAQENWRKTRLDKVSQELKELGKEQSEIESRIQELETRRRQIETLVAEFPENQLLLTATSAAAAVEQRLDETSGQLADAQKQETDQQSVFDKATTNRDQDAADFGLSKWATRTTELKNRLQQYESCLETLEARVDAARTVIVQSQQSREDVDRAKQRQQSIDVRIRATEIELGKTNEKVRVLEESAGQSVAAMMQRLNDKRLERKSKIEEEEAVAKRITELEKTIAVTESKREQRELESSSFDEQRKESTNWFSTLHECQLVQFVALDVEIPALPWSMTAAIKLARQVDGQLVDVPADEESWLASQTRLHRAQTELQQTVLSQDAMTVEVEPLRDGLQRVNLSILGERLAPAAAAVRLESEISTRERILDEKEQDTLEKYLLGEVAEGLRKGMRMASDLVSVMTNEVSIRPMKTGMQMRFKWCRDEEGPAGLAAACEVLATDSATWSPDEREQIKQFLQRSIRMQRETEQTGSWHEHMRAALDYRRWHRIVIERRSGPEANWLKLTRRTYAGGSGGEKAIALTLPPLAAAAAYYKSAHPTAPRFILLDEAFAGISSDMRENCMELITAFGLDFVMTSESEWGMYAGVKQLAICQLDRFSDINAVVNRVFIWNGSEKRQMTSQKDLDEQSNQPIFSED